MHGPKVPWKRRHSVKASFTGGIPSPQKVSMNGTNRKENIYLPGKGSQMLFMAGCYKSVQGQHCFVILTTRANASVSSVHDRMPLLLEKSAVGEWLNADSRVEYYLQSVPPLLTAN